MLEKLSQSMVKDWHDFEKCKLQFFHKFILKDYPHTPSDLMFKGLYFEQELIGSTRDGELIDYEPLKSGKYPKAKTDLDELVQEAKGVMESLKVESLEVQPEWETETLLGHPDLIANLNGKKAIVDIKYTETQPDDKWRGWGDPENMNHIQAYHYVLMGKEIYGEYLPFYYIVFGKQGWVKFIQVRVTKESLENYQDLLQETKKQISQFDFSKVKGQYNQCYNCPLVNNCAKKSTTPELLVVAS